MAHDHTKLMVNGSGEGGSTQHQQHVLAYDPDQDLNEKRQIRKGYRILLDEANELSANIKNIKVSEIEAGLQRGNRLFERVKDTSEATLDSRYLMMASDMGAAKAKAMKSDGNGFDVDDFVSKLVTFMGGYRSIQEREGSEDIESQAIEDEADDDEDDGSHLDWEKVGYLALAKSHRVPIIDFMLGPLSIEQKQRKKVNRAKFEKNNEPERAPQELTEEDIQRSENETTKNVTMIADLLQRQEKINLFRFITNPNSFGQSVENLFYLSFLVREGTCAMEFDEETGEPIIFACEPPNEEDFRDGARKQQIVLELDMDTWERAIQVFNIQDCIIPNRKEVETRLGGKKWVG